MKIFAVCLFNALHQYFSTFSFSHRCNLKNFTTVRFTYLCIKVTGHISGWGNHARLESASLTQTSQLGPGERPRMCTMQTAKAVEDPCEHAEIWWSIPNRTFHQIAQQLLTLQARPTCSKRVTIAPSD